MFYANIVHVGPNGTVECLQQATGTRKQVDDAVRAFNRTMRSSHPEFPTSHFEVLQDSHGKLLYGNAEGEKVAVLHNLDQRTPSNFNEVARHQTAPAGSPRLPVGRSRFKGGAAVRGSHPHGRFASGSGARGAKSPYR